jgi:hypothetical protein
LAPRWLASFSSRETSAIMGRMNSAWHGLVVHRLVVDGRGVQQLRQHVVVQGEQHLQLLGKALGVA